MAETTTDLTPKSNSLSFEDRIIFQLEHEFSLIEIGKLSHHDALMMLRDIKQIIKGK